MIPEAPFILLDAMPTWVRLDQIAAVFAEDGGETQVSLLNGRTLTVDRLVDDVMQLMTDAAETWSGVVS